MRHEDDVSIMVSGRPDFGERKTRGEVRRVDVSNRQQTTYSGHHEKAPVGRGGGDRAPGREQESGTAPISSAGTPPRGGTTSARAEETTATWLERNISTSGPDGKSLVKEALIRHLLRWCERQTETGTEPLGATDVPITTTTGSAQGEFPETPTWDGPPMVFTRGETMEPSSARPKVRISRRSRPREAEEVASFPTQA